MKRKLRFEILESLTEEGCAEFVRQSADVPIELTLLHTSLQIIQGNSHALDATKQHVFLNLVKILREERDFLLESLSSPRPLAFRTKILLILVTDLIIGTALPLHQSKRICVKLVLLLLSEFVEHECTTTDFMAYVARVILGVLSREGDDHKETGVETETEGEPITEMEAIVDHRLCANSCFAADYWQCVLSELRIMTIKHDFMILPLCSWIKDFLSDDQSPTGESYTHTLTHTNRDTHTGDTERDMLGNTTQGKLGPFFVLTEGKGKVGVDSSAHKGHTIVLTQPISSYGQMHTPSENSVDELTALVAGQRPGDAAQLVDALRVTATHSQFRAILCAAKSLGAYHLLSLLVLATWHATYPSLDQMDDSQKLGMIEELGLSIVMAVNNEVVGLVEERGEWGPVKVDSAAENIRALFTSAVDSMIGTQAPIVDQRTGEAVALPLFKAYSDIVVLVCELCACKYIDAKLAELALRPKTAGGSPFSRTIDQRSGDRDMRTGDGDMRTTDGDMITGDRDMRTGAGDMRIGEGDMRTGDGDVRIGEGDMEDRTETLALDERSVQAVVETFIEHPKSLVTKLEFNRDTRRGTFFREKHTHHSSSPTAHALWTKILQQHAI